MRVLALIPSQKGHSPGQRGSIELWEDILKPAGIELSFAPFETDKLREVLYTEGKSAAKIVETIRSYAERVKLLQRVDEYDAVFIYREAALLGPAFLEKRIARKKPIIYQLDDPLFVPYRSPSNGYLSYLKFFGKVKDIISLAKVVFVNSTPIREYAEQFNKNIWQVPSVVDTDKFTFKPFAEKLDRVCVGWSGSPTTRKNIEMLEGALQTISNLDICDIHLIGSTDFGIEKVNYTAQKWCEETEVDDLRRLQVGLIPLPEHPWNPYKFIMKTSQYMALGIVPVATPMASNTEVIRHGENGFLAATSNEWVEYLTLLIKDNKLRTQLSAQAAKDAEEKFSLRAHTANIIAAFRSAVD